MRYVYRFAVLACICALSMGLNSGTPVSEAQAENPGPLSVVVILDTSGSMQGQRLAEAKRGMQMFFDSMGGSIEASLVTFKDCEARVTIPMAVQRGETLQRSKQAVNGVRAYSATPIVTAYRKAHDILKKRSSRRKGILLVTDGLGNCKDENSFCSLSDAYRKEDIQTVVVGYLLSPSAASNFVCSGSNLYYGINANTPPQQYGRRLMRSLFRARREFLSHVDPRYLKGAFDEVNDPVCLQKHLGKGWMVIEMSEVRGLNNKKYWIANDTPFDVMDPHPMQPGGTLRGMGKVDVGAEDIYRKVDTGGIDKEVEYYLDAYHKAKDTCAKESPDDPMREADDMFKDMIP